MAEQIFPDCTHGHCWHHFVREGLRYGGQMQRLWQCLLHMYHANWTVLEWYIGVLSALIIHCELRPCYC